MSKHTKKSKIKIITIPMDCLRDKAVKYICNLLLLTRVFSWRFMFIYISRISEQVRKWLCNLIKFKMRNLSQQQCSQSYKRVACNLPTCRSHLYHLIISRRGGVGPHICVRGIEFFSISTIFLLELSTITTVCYLCFSFRFILTTNERSVSQLGKTQRN